MSSKRKIATPTRLPGNHSDEARCYGVANGDDLDAAADREKSRFGSGCYDNLPDNNNKSGARQHDKRGDLWRLSSMATAADTGSDGVDDDVMDSIRAVIGSARSLDDKQRTLSVMIAQLQSLKDNLRRPNAVSCALMLLKARAYN